MSVTRFLRIGLAFGAAVLLHAQGGPPGGSINALHAIEGPTRWVYAATDSGVWRSRDDGGTWEAFNEGLPVDQFVVQSISGVTNQLFAALDGGGVWRWRNQGPWEQTSDGIGDLQTLAVAAKPGDPQVVLAGTRSQGVFLSNNGGDGWIRPGTLTVAGSFPEIAFSPSDPQRILVAANPGLAIESRDGGQSWNARLGVPGVTFRGIAFDPLNPDVAYASSTFGLFRQPAPGQNFELLSATSGRSLTDVAVDPADSNVIYAADQALNVIVSKDRGATFTIGSGLPQAGGFSLLALPESPTRLLAGAFGTGVFVSEDQGASFGLSSIGLNGADVLSIAVDPRNAGVLYASMSGGGMFKTVNSGDSWKEARTGLFQFSPVKVAIDPADSNRIYSGSVNPFDSFDGSLQRSDDAGATWQSVLTNAPALGLALHPTDGQTVWYGTSSGLFGNLDSLYRSREHGNNPQALLATLNIRGIALDPSNPRNVYAISELNGVYQMIRSGNEGDSFSGTGQTTIRMFTVVVDPGNTQTIYLGTDAGVYRSTDSGQNFTTRNAGLPNGGAVVVASLAIDPRDGAIYAATTSGVFRSTDASASWQAANAGLDGIAVRQVAVDPHTPKGLYAATAGAGVYRSADGGASWEPTGTNTAVISREGIVGAFDFSGEGVAPGELVSIFGQGIGPSQGIAVTSFDPATGKLPTEAGGVRVFFNDIPAPLLYVSATQINAQVPFEAVGLNPPRVSVRVEFDGLVSNTAQVSLLETHPGLFPTAVNLDGSLNSETARTASGNYALFYATGQGATNPAAETGARPPATEPFARPKAQVRVLIGGRETTVYFAGLVPPYVGLMQMNVLIPPGLAPGKYDVELHIGARAGGKVGTVWVGP